MRARRVAIIGTKGFQRSDEQVEIECFSWKRVANIANPSDYDTIILNLVSLTDRAAVAWDGFFDKFSRLTTLQVLVSGGNIVIIGDPRFWPNEPAVLPGGEEVPGRQFLEWTGIQFDWDDNSGKTKVPVEPNSSAEPYLNYIEKISRWDYCLRGCGKWPGELLATLADMLGKPRSQLVPTCKLERICENRYGGLIVFAVKISISDRIDVGGGYVHKNAREGRIIFLPQIDVPQEEAVAMVLTDIVGIQVVVPEPSWACDIVAPGQPHIDTRITQVKRDIAAFEEELRNAKEDREKVRRCVHLLYKFGSELENVVREILGALGSTIELPTEPGKADGLLTVEIEGETLNGVLEIKGTRKDYFNISGLRQLMEWKYPDGPNSKNEYKAIFVGNSGAEKEISKRKMPFSDTWKVTAERNEIAVLDTRDLYHLYCLDCEGNLDKNKFWRALFQTNGVFSVDDLRIPKA